MPYMSDFLSLKSKKDVDTPFKKMGIVSVVENTGFNATHRGM